MNSPREHLNDHHHHPLSDIPCSNGQHHAATADPRQRHVFGAVYVDPVGLLTMTPWMSLDAATQIAEDRRGAVVAFPVVADFSSGPSMFAAGSWPAAKQTPAELEQAVAAHTAEQERRAYLAAQEAIGRETAARHAAEPTDPEPTRPFTGFFNAPTDGTRYDNEQHYARSFNYDPDDGAGVPIRITEVRR